MAKNGQNKAKMAKFGKINYFTKIALVYLCLCQIFIQIKENKQTYMVHGGTKSQRKKIEKPKFWTELWSKMAKIGPKWPNLAKQIILLKSH